MSLRPKLILILAIVLITAGVWSVNNYRNGLDFDAEAVLTNVQAKQADKFVDSIGVVANGVLDSSHWKLIDDAAWTSIWKPRLLELGVRHFRTSMSDMGSGLTSFKRHAEALSSLSNPPTGYQPAQFLLSFPSSSATGASSFDNCFLIKVKLLLQGGSTQNCGSDQNVTVNAKVRIVGFEGLNESDHCFSWKAECQLDDSTWYDRQTAVRPTWLQETLDTARIGKEKLASDTLTKDIPTLSYSPVHVAEYSKAIVQNYDETAKKFVNKLDANGQPVYRDIPTAVASLKDSLQYANYGNIHQYCNRAQSYCIPSSLSHEQAYFGNLPLWMTEFGWTMANATVTEKVQAKYLTRGYLTNFDTGIVRSYAFTIRDRIEQSSDAEKYFGIIKDNGTPKVSYTWLKNMIAHLQDPGADFSPGSLSYTVTPTDASARVKHNLFQKRDGSYWLVIYNDVFSGTDTDVTTPVTLTFGQAMDFNVFGVESMTELDTKINTTSLSISVPDSIRIVKILPTTTTPDPDPSPTPDPDPEPTIAHIGDIDAKKTIHQSGQRWRTTYTVRVEDANHKPIANTTVTFKVEMTGSSGGSTISSSCITASTGACSYTTAWQKNNISSIKYTIIKALHPTITYNSTLNHDPETDSNGTTISVSR